MPQSPSAGARTERLQPLKVDRGRLSSLNAYPSCWSLVMLTASQRACLETMIRRVSVDLHLEAATLAADQTLELVLCGDFVCFRPLRIEPKEVNVLAALEGQVEAQEALEARLRVGLQGLLP